MRWHKLVYFILLFSISFRCQAKALADISNYQVNITNKIGPQNGANIGLIVNQTGFIPTISQNIYNPTPMSNPSVGYGATLSFSYGGIGQARPDALPTLSYALCLANAPGSQGQQGLCPSGYFQADLCSISYFYTSGTDQCGYQKVSGQYCFVNSMAKQGNACVLQITFTPNAGARLK